MATVIVNARVDAKEKERADAVLAAERRTWSQAIQALVTYISRTHKFPEVLDEPSPDEMAERQRKLDLLMSVCGIVTSPELITDEDDERILFEEMMRRRG